MDPWCEGRGVTVGDGAQRGRCRRSPCTRVATGCPPSATPPPQHPHHVQLSSSAPEPARLPREGKLRHGAAPTPPCGPATACPLPSPNPPLMSSRASSGAVAAHHRPVPPRRPPRPPSIDRAPRRQRPLCAPPAAHLRLIMQSKQPWARLRIDSAGAAVCLTFAESSRRAEPQPLPLGFVLLQPAPANGALPAWLPERSSRGCGGHV